MIDVTKILTRDQVRQLDQTAIQRFGIPGVVLMENAGRNLTDLLCEQGPKGKTLIFCGGGNNAGDGFVIARHLHLRGYGVLVVLCANPEKFCGDALTQYQIFQKSGLPSAAIYPCGTAEEVTKRLNALPTSGDWLVDALLGTGAQGEPRFPINAIIPWMNASGKKILAVDIPSGLDCDTGQPASQTIRATVTGTLAALKPGLIASAYTGPVRVLDIGFSE